MVAASAEAAAEDGEFNLILKLSKPPVENAQEVFCFSRIRKSLFLFDYFKKTIDF